MGMSLLFSGSGLFETAECLDAALSKLALHVVGSARDARAPDKVTSGRLGIDPVEIGHVADEATETIAMINLFDLYSEG
ncbi:hypothetical protein LJR257_003696 [Ensifer adhaerens]